MIDRTNMSICRIGPGFWIVYVHRVLATLSAKYDALVIVESDMQFR